MEFWDNIELAEQALTEGRFQEARELFFSQVQVDGERAWAGCTRASLRLNELERAHEECEECRKASVASGGSWGTLALALLHSYGGSCDKVADTLLQCESLAFSPTAFVEAWECLYYAYVDSGRWDLAERMLFGQHPGGHFIAARAKCARELGEPDRELQFLNCALEEPGFWPGHLLARAELYFDIEEDEKAHQDLLEALDCGIPEISSAAQDLLSSLEQGLPMTKSADEFLDEGAAHRALRKMEPADQVQLHLKRNQIARAFELAGHSAHDLSVEEQYEKAIDVLELVCPDAPKLRSLSALIRSMTPGKPWDDWTLSCLCKLARLHLEHGSPQRTVELFEQLMDSPNRLAVLEDLCRATKVEGAPAELDALLAEALVGDVAEPEVPVDPVSLFGGQEFRDGERVRGPGNVWFSVSIEGSPELDGESVKLSSLAPYYPVHPGNDSWLEIWMNSHGLLWGQNEWGFLGSYWMEGAQIELNFTRPIERTISESFDMTTGKVFLSDGQEPTPERGGRLSLENGVLFQVSCSDEVPPTHYLTLVEPTFLSLPRIPGQVLRFGSTVIFQPSVIG